MRAVLRSFFALLLGFVVGSVLIMAVELLGSVLYPPPPGIDPNNWEALRASFINAPIGAQLFVLLAWALGTIAAGMVAAWIAKGSPIIHALVLGAVFLAAGIFNMITIPSPAWFWALGILLFLPCAYLGAKLTSSAKAKQA